MDVFKLSRQWFDWSFENPELIKPNHTALYFFIIEQCNRLGWKEKFGLPTTMAKEAIGIKSYNTYIDTLNDLVAWGFITMIEKSKNQYSSNIVALSNFDIAHNKALDKALIKHASKQSESTGESISSIDIQETIEPETRNNSTPLSPAIASTPSPAKHSKFDFKAALIKIGVSEQVAAEYMAVRKTKRATNTKTAFDDIEAQIMKTGKTAQECIAFAVKKSWAGFESSWMDNAAIPLNNNQQKQPSMREAWNLK